MSIARTPYTELPGALVDELTHAGLDSEDVYRMVVRAFDEDLPDGGSDVTSNAMPPMGSGVGDIAAREAGIVAGLGVAELVFVYAMGSDVEVTHRVPDGSRVSPGDVAMRVAGPVTDLLTAERTALNFASHLSGIATETDRWVAALAGTRARVLDTRKTLPTYRSLQKYAVRCGGGVNHRFSLSDRALVKDNHVVAAGGALRAYERVREANPGLRVEVEVTDLDQLRELLGAGCTEILLDNMDTATMAEAVRLVERTGAVGRVTLEASGGLTLDRALEVAQTGVDFISVGGLTHSVTALDLGLDMR
ncbi:MAG TPA: carboxylating nicotinate-nucleotide diphosphorylase [Nocardioides sp.]|uniref:carboxylating nicotinate-nucleotide diphosphorylase n=1 Tax=Nocardioides sp. TaxID=35761 RepID=UPI002F41ABD8